MESELDDVLTDSDSVIGNEEEKSTETSLLQDIGQEAAAESGSEGGKSSTCFILSCNWNLVKKVVIVIFLWIAYFLCNAAFSTIAPFFPKEARHHETQLRHHNFVNHIILTSCRVKRKELPLLWLASL